MIFASITVLVICFVFYYCIRAAKAPQLVFNNNRINQKIVSSLSRLHRPFKPTPWAFNSHLQLIVLVVKEFFSTPLRYDRVEVIGMEDGGTTGLCWVGDGLAEDSPIIVVLHTINGTPQSMSQLVDDLHRFTGWKTVLCVRRGHVDINFTTPKYNSMGDTNDLRAQLDTISARFPCAPLYMLGSSAGSGLLVRYLGEPEVNDQVKGAFAYCPGYDISIAFQRSHDFYSRLMAKKLVKNFVEPNRHLFQSKTNLSQLLNAENLHDFHQHLFAVAGFESHDHYLEHINPVTVMDNIRIPIMVLNSEDDPVCVLQNVLEYKRSLESMEKSILVITKRGSHCAHLTGWLAQSWSHQLAADYFKALEQL